MILRSLRGAVNGFTYGARIRFVHALVMGILFKKTSLFDKVKDAFLLARDHGVRLALFVFIYKTIVGALEIILKGAQHWHTFIGGAIGGFFIFRKWNPINAQIVMYLMARNLLGGAEKLRRMGYFPKKSQFAILATVCWGVVMLFYDLDASVLQKSLASSMDYLYKETEKYESWRNFIPFLN